VTDVGLLWVCTIAFAAVFTLLTVLAAVMHLVTVVFPERRAAIDPAVSAAISTTVATLFPGARVTRIEEEDR
jgi:hypothetical protein